MEDFWKQALKTTGPVAVIGFLISLLLTLFFKTEIISVFSSMQVFVFAMTMLCALLIILFTAVFLHYSNNNKPAPSTLGNSKTENTANISNSKIEGDFVMGNKIENSDKSK